MLSKRNQHLSPAIAFSAVLSALTIFIMLITSGCGKNEAGGTMVGGATGAVLGAAVAGRSGQGAVVGGLAGALLGSAIGRGADRDDEREDREMAERVQARRLAATKQQLEQAEHENRHLRQATTKWCVKCRKQSSITDARSCAYCGGDLAAELLCRSCTRVYSPQTGYVYCPSCRGGVVLTPR